MTDYVVKTENLCFSYSKSSNDIKQIDLNIPSGSVFGFLGANGAGKTTTIRLLLGLLKKQKGNVFLFGKSFENNRIACLRKIGALIETPSLYEHLSAAENLKITAKYRKGISAQRIEEVLSIVNLSHASKKKVKTFSLGMKQRLSLAISLLSNPELLILDEPTNGLDPKGIIEIRELIKELNTKHGITILISSHLLTEIEKTCTHVGIIQKGKMIFQDTVDALKMNRDGKIKLKLEVSDIPLAKQLIQTDRTSKVIVEDGQIITEITNKEEISEIIDKLRSSSIDIFQVIKEDSLEELFLSLTKNE